MAIDPVVVLAEELRTAQHTLQNAREADANTSFPELLAQTVFLYRALLRTVPTSALGAGELARLSAGYIQNCDRERASQMNQVADRLMAGTRTPSDLVWLRSTARALSDGICGEEGMNAARFLCLAICGAARPVLVYRAVEPIDGFLERGTGTI